MSRQIKLYNIIFPIWFLWIIPPVIGLALVGNFLIDSGVMLLGFVLFKVGAATGLTKKELYKKSILKVWLFGFLADIIATIPLMLILTVEFWPVPNDVRQALAMNPFSNTWALITVILCMILACVFIFIFNYNISFKDTIKDKALRAKLAIFLAVITMPWTFLIPSQILYKGF